jgi:ParB family transcriptional regulator, chromosome partitioning protein
MQLEWHQLDRSWEHLRVRDRHRQARLMASLVESGQQSPIVVVRAEGADHRYVVIDGYQRLAALEQLGRDTVEATLWEMSEAEAVLLDRSLRYRRQETALEQGWLLSDLRRRFGYSVEQLGRRFDRGTSWVSRRLALADVLPELIQQEVRHGRISAHIAMKYLAPAARVSPQDCEKLAAAFLKCGCDARQAGQLYAAWKSGSRVSRERIFAEPALYLKTQAPATAAIKTPAAELERDIAQVVNLLERANGRLGAALADLTSWQLEQLQEQVASAQRELERLQERTRKEQEGRHVEPGTTNSDSGAERQASGAARDCARVEVVAIERAHSVASELGRRTGDRAAGKGRTLPPADSRAVGELPGESGAGP